MELSEIPTQSWCLPCLEVRDSAIHGKGVFTSQPIKTGETVIIWGGIVLTLEEFYAGKGLPHTNVGIDENVFLAAEADEEMTIDDYMNHSCDPNLWLADEVTLIARRDIDANEELTIDYAIELADENYVMKVACNCGALNCRRRITGKDWRLRQVQEANRDHFSPFINRRIQRLSGHQSSHEKEMSS